MRDRFAMLAGAGLFLTTLQAWAVPMSTANTTINLNGIQFTTLTGNAVISLTNTAEPTTGAQTYVQNIDGSLFQDNSTLSNASASLPGAASAQAAVTAAALTATAQATAGYGSALAEGGDYFSVRGAGTIKVTVPYSSSFQVQAGTASGDAETDYYATIYKGYTSYGTVTHTDGTSLITPLPLTDTGTITVHSFELTPGTYFLDMTAQASATTLPLSPVPDLPVPALLALGLAPLLMRKRLTRRCV